MTDLVVAAGADPGDAKKALRSPDCKNIVIVREAGAQTTMGADQAEIVWSSCSSLAHGDVYGTLSILERNVIDTQGDSTTDDTSVIAQGRLGEP